MSCLETLQAYAFRSLGYGERLLPKTDIQLCDQLVLIGSGMIWNVYFATLALLLGFLFATLLALGKASRNPLASIPSRTFIYVFRGTPLFVQMFFAYEIFVQLPKVGVDIDLGITVITAETRWLTKAWAGALFVLFLNTSAYTAEIFYGALRAVPKGDVEAADAIGMHSGQKFRRMLRLAWPSYTNEAIFLYHATALAFAAGFPAWRQQGDALYYAQYFAENTFNPFIAYPIAAGYYILGTVGIILAFGWANRRLNRHLAPSQRQRLKLRPQFIR
jgi:polar amino acid transport system permease protein